MGKEILKNLINVKTGKLDANDSTENGQYPFFTCSKEPLKIDSYSYDCECVLVAGNGDLNAKYYKGKFDAYQRTYILESRDKDILDVKYLYFFMQKYVEKLRQLSIGGVIKYIKLNNINDALINLVDIQEQRKIVETLSQVNDTIQIRKRQISELNNLIKSQFVEMFITNRNASWRLKKLKEVCIFNPKKLKISNVPDDFKVSFIPMTAVSENGEIDTSDIRDYKEVNRGFTYFSENDVLFAKITPCMENGKGAVAINLKNKIGFGSTEFHVVRPKETMNSRWIYTLFSLSFFRNEAEKNMTGSAGQKRVPIKFIENYEIFVPPIELQNQFADFVQHIDKLEFARIGQIDSAKANPFLAIKKKPQFY